MGVEHVEIEQDFGMLHASVRLIRVVGVVCIIVIISTLLRLGLSELDVCLLDVFYGFLPGLIEVFFPGVFKFQFSTSEL